MAVLVAGGCGYIGAHVAKELHQKGFDVVVYDNLSRGYRCFAKWGEFVPGDIGDLKELNLVFDRFPIDAVMHFSAFIEVAESVAKPAHYYRNNTAGTLALLEAMRKKRVDTFIFSSTAAVYGAPRTTPIREEDPAVPINPYGASKQMVERMLEDFCVAYGLKSIRFRYFNAAGASRDADIGEAHVPETHLIPIILDAAMGKRDGVDIFGTDYETRDGTCVRDYVHVEDLAEAHVRGLEFLLEQRSGTWAMNLGSEDGHTVREVIDTVKQVTLREIEVREAPRRAGDPPSLVAKTQRAAELLDWRPRKDLTDIVEDAWRWHQKLQTIELA